jgi:tetratricopeptide (TPR) repeat protein
MRKFDEARLDFEKAIFLGYEGTNPLINLGVTYLGDPQKAQPFFEKALKIDPLCALAFGYLSACSNKLGNYKESLEYANKAIDIDNSNMYFFEQRALAYRGLEMHEECIKDYDMFID